MSSRSRIVLASSTLAALVAACGGAAESAPPQSAPRVENEPEPTTVEDAQRQIARARAELGAPNDATSTNTGSSADSAAPAKREPSALPPPSPTRPKSSDKKSVEEGPARTSDSCQSPCRAIASMRRAVTALCRMTGDDDTRCGEAKKTLADSETRLAPCGC